MQTRGGGEVLERPTEWAEPEQELTSRKLDAGFLLPVGQFSQKAHDQGGYLVPRIPPATATHRIRAQKWFGPVGLGTRPRLARGRVSLCTLHTPLRF